MALTKQQIGAIIVVLLFGGSAVVYAISAAFPGAEDVTGPEGHMILEVRICNEDKDLPTAESEINGGYITISDDSTVTFPTDSTVTLGDVFDTMNVTFSETELMGYENNNMCDTGHSNEVIVYRGRVIEGMEEELRRIEQYRGYQLEHGDHIRVMYN